MNLKKLNEMDSKELLFLCVILVTLGVVLVNLLNFEPVGIAFIAIGGLLFILGMRKRKIENKNDEN